MDIIEKIAGNIDLSTNERIKAIRLEMINKYDLFHQKSSKIKSDLGKKLCQFIKMISNLYKRRIKDFLMKNNINFLSNNQRFESYQQAVTLGNFNTFW